MSEESETKTVLAPQPVPPDSLPPNRVVQVELGEEEEVEWTWTTLPGGQRYVSGYTIRKKGN